MSEHQKPRDALQAIANIDDTTNHSVDASAALDRIGQIAREALALPTAEQVDDINAAESFTSVTKTAAPVGELPEPRAWMMEWGNHSPSFTTDKSDYVSWFAGKASYPDELKALYTADQMRAYARASLSAGDAVDAHRYRLLRTKIYIDPKELIIRIRDVFLTSGATLPEMLDAAIDAAMRKGQL